MADGALRDAASWFLNERHEGRPVDGLSVEAASKRFGFAGVTVSSSTFETSSPSTWREWMGRAARQQRVARYGISVAPNGKWAAVVLGSTELTYTPIPRTFKSGQSVQLKGEVDARYTSHELILATPDGRLERKPSDGRAFDSVFTLPGPGSYRLEVVGDGSTGPVVLSNVPLYVDAAEPMPKSVDGDRLAPDAAEARLLAMLNEARRSANVRVLQNDGELRDVALAHSTDMVDASFFGHVSPSTGTTGARVERSGIPLSKFGENVASMDTAEAAHVGLMGSPGHRANMLDASFTHVGIGVRAKDGGLVITMLFGRRPNPAELPVGAAQVEAALLALRAEKSLPVAKADPLYRVAAEAGAVAFADGQESSAVTKAAQVALERELTRLQTSRPATCVIRAQLLEFAELADIPGLLSPSLKRFGVGARLKTDERGTRRLATLLLFEDPAPCD